MSKQNVSDPDARRHGADLAAAEFSTFRLEEAADDRIMRSSFWIAAAAHLLLLMINFPAFSDRVIAHEKAEKKIFVVKPIRCEQPPVPPTPIPPERVRRVAAPDPTPDAPEPIRIEEAQPEVELPAPDVDFVIPEAPPMPEPEGIIRVGGDVRRPEKIHVVQPRYTELARRARIQGTVIVQAIIDEEGLVNDVTVLKGLPMGLSEEAVKAVRQWRFTPATLKGRPVMVYFNLTVRFHLQ